MSALVPLFIVAFFGVWIGALVVLMTDPALGPEVRRTWILPLVFLPPLMSIAFFVVLRRLRNTAAAPGNTPRRPREPAAGPEDRWTNGA